MPHRIASADPTVPLRHAARHTRRRYGIVFKALLLVLITANTVYFALFEGISEALDASAWLLLLLLFLAEPYSERLTNPHLRLALRAVRLVAAAGVLLATAGYVFEEDLLDAVNSAVWIAVVVLLELEVRFRGTMARRNIAFTAAGAVLYGALMVLVVAWAAQGEWFDAYDAILWLTAFGTIELDLARARQGRPESITTR